MAVKTIDVQILGQNYSIKVDADEAYVKSLAQYVDKKLREVYSSIPSANPLKVSIIASLNIADEFFKLKMERESWDRLIEEKTRLLSGLLDEIKTGEGEEERVKKDKKERSGGRG